MLIASGDSEVDAFLNGLHHSLYVASAIALGGALVAAFTIRSHARERTAPETAGVPESISPTA